MLNRSILSVYFPYFTFYGPSTFRYLPVPSPMFFLCMVLFATKKWELLLCYAYLLWTNLTHPQKHYNTHNYIDDIIRKWPPSFTNCALLKPYILFLSLPHLNPSFILFNLKLKICFKKNPEKMEIVGWRQYSQKQIFWSFFFIQIFHMFFSFLKF